MYSMQQFDVNNMLCACSIMLFIYSQQIPSSYYFTIPCSFDSRENLLQELGGGEGKQTIDAVGIKLLDKTQAKEYHSLLNMFRESTPRLSNPQPSAVSIYHHTLNMPKSQPQLRGGEYISFSLLQLYTDDE